MKTKLSVRNNVFGFIVMCLVSLLSFTSCNNAKDGKVELDVTNAEVEGDNNDIVSIEDGNYTLVGTVKGDMGQELYIQVKVRLKNPVKKSAEEISFVTGNVNLEIIDKNDMSMIKLPLKENEEFKKFITEGKEDDTKEFKFSYVMNDKDQYAQIMKEAKSVKLVDLSLYNYENTDMIADEGSASYDEDIDNSSDIDNSDDNDETTDDDSSFDETSEDNNLDELLDKYEEYYDTYISLMKKAKNGDMSAVVEYGKYLKKSQELSKKIEQAKGDLTTSQLARFQKIQMKLMKAMKEL
ncbi:DUF6591 domain-containing protein [Segatella copri]|uniref:DUF4369 domain-containing protein n=1 Tax=Segatella copri DSM 18205 TaxID=537011 RepID=D1PHP4_9BACT|nr:DUF6591 domain-containing protein [Segatella copri]EFB33794.1 hypothetical protein PREVCOP_06764 [Segatella copri DSM 18205]MCW4096697.1 hypothetical protein [Segatella copri]MQP20393.1 hypothetical protein [Segatella copri DSM 18205]UEA43789.1 hypothetical protein LK433_04265 [Segatella copri DSM 18205]UWP51598.1 hypothetical protein NQ544_09765 [Segatella copri DSM 18205]